MEHENSEDSPSVPSAHDKIGDTPVDEEEQVSSDDDKPLNEVASEWNKIKETEDEVDNKEDDEDDGEDSDDDVPLTKVAEEYQQKVEEEQKEDGGPGGYDGVKLKDSNMAGYGGKEHKDLREKAAKMEPAWKDAGTKEGIEIWRVENHKGANFGIKRWPKNRYGEFYNGDSFIVLHSIGTPKPGVFIYHAFYWLGAETTQDEAGVAAYKIVELDDLLGDQPVLYREIQGNESQLFVELFPMMKILDGGIASGFRHVRKQKAKPRLFHIQGYLQNVQVFEVPMKLSSLNDYDAYVLDAGKKIWQFHGKNATVWEKRRANTITVDLISQRFGRAKCLEIVTGANDPCDEFWAHFGDIPPLGERVIRSEDKLEKAKAKKMMMRVSDANGKMEVTVVSDGKLSRQFLDSDDIFIVDNGVAIYIWVGRGSSLEERRYCMTACVNYLKANGRDTNIPIVRVLEGKEPEHFDHCIDETNDSSTLMSARMK